jgi:hypothetical protein
MLQIGAKSRSGERGPVLVASGVAGVPAKDDSLKQAERGPK